MIGDPKLRNARPNHWIVVRLGLDMCPHTASVRQNHHRFAGHGDLAVPFLRMTKYRQRSFTVSGSTQCDFR